MRFEKAAAVLDLARSLAATSEGLTLDEMMQSAGVSRRTAERMRNAVEDCFGALDRLPDDHRIRFRLSAHGMGSFAVTPTTAEMTELENAARACENAQDITRAAALRSLGKKIMASLREGERRRLFVDVEGQVRGEAFARQVGPRPLSDPHTLNVIREAILACRMVRFRYGASDEVAEKVRVLVPYGILFGKHYYLVASNKTQPEPALYRLDRISEITVDAEPGSPPQDFQLQAYAARSFGVFQEEPQDVVLSFDPSAAEDAKAYCFHPTQTLTPEEDGSLTVRFKAGGLLQMVHHLMTWGPTVTIVKPAALRRLMRKTIGELQRQHGAKPRHGKSSEDGEKGTTASRDRG